MEDLKMKASEFNTSNFLNAVSATEYAGKTLKIYEVNAEIIRDVRKMTIGFEGIEKTLVVNKSNREILVEAYGDETAGWIGRSVRIDIVKVMFEGKRTNSISLSPVEDVSLPDASAVLADAPKKGKK
jgi:hypothetical protein